MKRIAKKICSTVCVLLAFSGNRGGALTKEILCNAGQWFACLCGYVGYYDSFNTKKEGEWVPEVNLTPGQKAFGYAFGAVTVLNAVDAAKRSYDIAHDVIKGSNNKPDTTNKKESKNYWPILEAIFGAVQLTFTFGHRPMLSTDCNGVCAGGLFTFVVGSPSLADAYFRYRESNQSNESQNSGRNPNTNNSDNIKAQKPKNKQ